MASFRLPPRRTIVVLFITFIVLALGFAGLQFYRFNSGDEMPITVTPRALIGGEVNELTVRGAQCGAVMHLPWGLLRGGDNGTFNWCRELSLAGGREAVRVLVCPWLNETSINFSMRGKNSTVHFDVRKGSSPLISGKGALDNLRQFTSSYPRRQTGNLMSYDAAGWIKQKLEGMGYRAEIRHYRWSDWLASRFGPKTAVNRPAGDILVVLGFKDGMSQNDWIVVGAHFDDAVGDRYSGEGAYDNGSGTCLMLELARAMKEIQTRDSFVFAAWGGEEEGLYGSERFIQELPAGVQVRFNLNLDMVGIGYPADYMIHLQVGPNATEDIDHPDLWAIADNITYEGMNISRNDSRIEIVEGTGGGSDHTRFQQQGVPTVFMITDWDYPAYHTNQDTFDNMVQYIGGEAALEESTDVDSWICLYISLCVDDCRAIHQGEVPYQ